MSAARRWRPTSRSSGTWQPWSRTPTGTRRVLEAAVDVGGSGRDRLRDRPDLRRVAWADHPAANNDRLHGRRLGERGFFRVTPSGQRARRTEIHCPVNRRFRRPVLQLLRHQHTEGSLRLHYARAAPSAAVPTGGTIDSPQRPDPRAGPQPGWQADQRPGAEHPIHWPVGGRAHLLASAVVTAGAAAVTLHLPASRPLAPFTPGAAARSASVCPRGLGIKPKLRRGQVLRPLRLSYPALCCATP